MFNRDFWIAVAKRAAWTMAETAVAMLPVGASVTDVGWPHVLGVAALAGIASVLKSIAAGVPEARKEGAEHGEAD